MTSVGQYRASGTTANGWSTVRATMRPVTSGTAAVSVKCRLDPVNLTAGKADSGKRLDHFLHEHLPAYSRARLQEVFEASLFLPLALTALAQASGIELLGQGQVELGGMKLESGSWMSDV